LTPLGFIVNLVAYISGAFTYETCSRFVRYEGAMAMIGINVVAIMMFLRVHALYYGQKWIIGGVLLILVIQFSMMTGLLTRGEAVLHNPASGVNACTLIFDP
jgi:cobalamin biosynthesis protein CobD/CbiB